MRVTRGWTLAAFFAGCVGWGNTQAQDLPNAYASEPTPAIPVATTTTADLERRITELESVLKSKPDESKKEMYEVGTDFGLTGHWNNGFELQSKNKDFKIHLGGRTQIDGTWLDGSSGMYDGRGGPPAPISGDGGQDAVNFRRARLAMEGTMWEIVDFNCEYDFVNGVNVDPSTTVLENTNVSNVPAPTDLWVQIRELPTIGNLRVGNIKEPLGLEHQNSSRFLDFMERSFNQDAYTGPFNNGFTPGILLYNQFDDQRGLWELGAFKNTQNPFAFGTGDGEYALDGRLCYLPWYDEPSQGRYMTHFGIGVSGRDLNNDQLRIRSRASLRNGPGTLNPVLADTGNFNGDNQYMLGGEWATVYGPLHLQAEYLASWVNNTVTTASTASGAPAGTPVGTYFTHGWYAQAMYFLTGEHRAFERKMFRFTRVIPYENFYLVNTKHRGCCLSKGAWQVGVRYALLNLDDGVIQGGQIQDITLGLNWFLNPNVKVQWNYVYTDRDAQFGVLSGGGHSNGFGMRVAFDW